MGMMIPTEHPRLAPVHLRAELLRRGLDDRAIGQMVRTGQLHRVRRGAYVAADVWAALDAPGRHAVRARAAERAARTAVVLSHVSGLPFYQDVPTSGVAWGNVHLTRLDGRSGRAEAGITQHRGRVLPGDVVELAGLGVMAPPRLLLETAATIPVDAALAVVNHFLHRGFTTLDALRQRYAGAMDHWPASLGTNAVLHLADPRIESVGESRTAYFLWAQGFPAPEPQHEIRDRAGRLVARVDFAWPELGVFLEFDGRIKYQQLLREGESPTDVVLREKRREELICALTGWRCVRITWADLNDPLRLAARIREAIAAQAAARRAG